MLIDTSGFLCLYERSEPFHANAVELYDQTSFRLTTNYILAEYTALAQARGIEREKIIDFSIGVLADESIEIVWIDAATHIAAVQLLSERADKNYSLCDAASFCVMRRRDMTEALTTDKHFEQEGFTRLLRKNGRPSR